MAQTGRELTDAERLAWLRLIRSENVGPITFFDLMRHFGSAEDALRALPDLARRGGRRGCLRIGSRAAAEREGDALRAAGARLIALGEPDYPRPLAAIADPPPLLSMIGHGHLLNKRIVAVVGARNASASGNRFARQIAGDLGAADYVVASGLARGIDTNAHEGALATGTVAVVAGSIDVVYPPENEDLHARIAEGGVVIAEMPPGTVPQGRHFPRRNRVIAGVALGTVVIEAAQRSGSLITAQLAGEQGRDVFAVPGSPLDPRCRGSNNLIRQGAILTESAADVVEVLESGFGRPVAEPAGPVFGTPPQATVDEATLDAARRDVLEKLGPTPVTVDEIIRQCQVTPSVVLTVLLELELAGRLDRHSGGQVSLILREP